jgi:hypothetical protein
MIVTRAGTFENAGPGGESGSDFLISLLMKKLTSRTSDPSHDSHAGGGL